MFIHNLKYSLKVLFKNKGLIFWTFVFPIILGTLFKMAFSNIENEEKLSVIDLAVIKNSEFDNDLMFSEGIKMLSDKESSERLFNVKYVSLDEAKKLLLDEKISGYILLDEGKSRVYVNKSDKEYNLNVVLSDSSSKVEGTGKLDLPSDKTIHEIKVTSENGDVRIYKLTVIKVSDTTSISDIISNLSVKVSGSVIYNISPNTNAGTLINSINKYSAGTTVTINESNGVGVGSGSTLKTGQTIKMITPSGESKSFVISIIGDVSGDGEVTILDLLKVQKHLLGSSKLSSEYLISGDTNGDAEVTILDLLRVQKYILKSITF